MKIIVIKHLQNVSNSWQSSPVMAVDNSQMTMDAQVSVVIFHAKMSSRCFSCDFFLYWWHFATIPDFNTYMLPEFGSIMTWQLFKYHNWMKTLKSVTWKNIRIAYFSDYSLKKRIHIISFGSIGERLTSKIFSATQY